MILKNKDGSSSEIIPIHKVSAGQKDEMGLVNCEIPATCKLNYLKRMNNASL